MVPLCIYHGNCADGFGAAWVVRKFFNNDVEFHPGFYGASPPTVTGRDVIIVDFSYKFNVLMVLASQARSLLILDHHESAEKDLGTIAPRDFDEGWAGWMECVAEDQADMPEAGGSLTAVFDMERSGAGLTWDFFFPDIPRPAFIDHIEDRDLWRFRLQGTEAIQAGIFAHPYDFDIWDTFEDPDSLYGLERDGTAILRKHHKDIDELLAVGMDRMVIAGYKVPVCNLPYTMSSDAGHKMCRGEPFAACYWKAGDKWTFSLRSDIATGGINVAQIASQFGGGGHPQAAGFEVEFLSQTFGAHAYEKGENLHDKEAKEREV